MSQSPAPMLAELPEDRAHGAIAVIYEEIRRFSGVPYVSSMQRYLATTPRSASFQRTGSKSGASTRKLPE